MGICLNQASSEVNDSLPLTSTNLTSYLLNSQSTSLQVSPLDCVALRLVFVLRVHRGRKMVHRHELLGALRHVHLLRLQGYEVRKSEFKQYALAHVSSYLGLVPSYIRCVKRENNNKLDILSAMSAKS